MKNIKNKFVYIMSAFVLLIPVVSFAALSGVKSLLTTIKTDILPDVQMILYSIAFIYFFWGVVQFIRHSDDQKARDEGKQKMIWGVIALFVMISIWGILGALGTATDIPTPASIPAAIP